MKSRRREVFQRLVSIACSVASLRLSSLLDERLQLDHQELEHVLFGERGPGRCRSDARFPARAGRASDANGPSPPAGRRRCRATARCSRRPSCSDIRRTLPPGVNTRERIAARPSARSRPAGTAAPPPARETGRTRCAASSMRARRSAAGRFARSIVSSTRFRTAEISIDSDHPLPRSAATSLAPRSPDRRVSTASVCWPSSRRRRADRARRLRQLDRRAQQLAAGPIVACSTSRSSSARHSCGSANTSCRSRTEPHGTPAAFSRSIQSAAAAVAQRVGRAAAAARRSSPPAAGWSRTVPPARARRPRRTGATDRRCRPRARTRRPTP